MAPTASSEEPQGSKPINPFTQMCVLESVYLGELTRKLHCSKLDILNLGDLLGFFIAKVDVWQCLLLKVFKLNLYHEALRCQILRPFIHFFFWSFPSLLFSMLYFLLGWNLHNKIYHFNHFWVCSPVALPTFTKLCNQQPPSISRTFSLSQTDTLHPLNYSPCSSSLSPGNHHSTLCLWI